MSTITCYNLNCSRDSIGGCTACGMACCKKCINSPHGMDETPSCKGALGQFS